MVGNRRKRTLTPPERVSLIEFLVSAAVFNPELKVIYTTESGIVLPVLSLYLIQNRRETRLSFTVFIG